MYFFNFGLFSFVFEFFDSIFKEGFVGGKMWVFGDFIIVFVGEDVVGKRGLDGGVVVVMFV